MLNSQTHWSRGLRFWNATAGSMPAFHRHRAKERKRARENKRKEGGGWRRRERKIRDPFVLGDMTMPEKEGTIVLE